MGEMTYLRIMLEDAFMLWSMIKNDKSPKEDDYTDILTVAGYFLAIDRKYWSEEVCNIIEFAGKIKSYTTEYNDTERFKNSLDDLNYFLDNVMNDDDARHADIMANVVYTELADAYFRSIATRKLNIVGWTDASMVYGCMKELFVSESSSFIGVIHYIASIDEFMENPIGVLKHVEHDKAQLEKPLFVSMFEKLANVKVVNETQDPSLN